MPVRLCTVVLLSFQFSASSTTNEVRPIRITPSNDPHEWSIDEVVRHIGEHDHALTPHAELFRKHVSTGIS